MKPNNLFFWAAVTWTLLIFILLVVPDGNLTKRGFLGIPHLDKLAHAIVFFLLVVLWFRALRDDGGKGRTKALALGLAQASFLYGTNMEFVQALFTTRAFEGLDIVADGIGALAGYKWVVRR